MPDPSHTALAAAQSAAASASSAATSAAHAASVIAEPTDAAVATLLGDPESATSVAASATYVTVVEAPLNASRYPSLAAAVTAASDAGAGRRGQLYIPPGNYTTDVTLVTPESFDQPQIFGANAKGTTITRTTPGPIFRFTGGSGELALSALRGVSLAGSGSGVVGIEFYGCNGMNVDQIEFGPTLAVGARFSNEARAGTFTEFNIIRDSHFLYTPRAIEYVRGIGNDSFHGSGFKDCVFNQNANVDGPMIVIGTGCKVYNAPWDGTFFGHNPSRPPFVRIDASESYQRPNTFGFLRSESGGTFIDPASSEVLVHAGTTMGIGNMSWGDKFFLADQIEGNPDGSMSTVGLRQQKRTALSGAAAPGVELTQALDEGSYTIAVWIEGPNYHADRLLHVWRSPYTDGGTITELAGSTFDQAGHGSPVFYLGSHRLYVRADVTPFTSQVYATTTLNGIGVIRAQYAIT